MAIAEKVEIAVRENDITLLNSAGPDAKIPFYIGEVGVERYVLGNPGQKHTLLCIGVNPSTADSTRYDPTTGRIRRLQESDKNTYDGWLIINPYPQCTPHPKNLDDLKKNPSAHTEKLVRERLDRNEKVLRLLKEYLKGQKVTVWACWGDGIEIQPYLKESALTIYEIFQDAEWLQKGSLTKEKHNPRHPLCRFFDGGFQPFERDKCFGG